MSSNNRSLGSNSNLPISVGELGTLEDRLEDRIGSGGALVFEPLQPQTLDAAILMEVYEAFDRGVQSTAEEARESKQVLVAAGIANLGLLGLLGWGTGWTAATFVGMAAAEAIILPVTGALAMNYSKSKTVLRRTKHESQSARQLREKGYVFASELSGVSLLPSSVSEVEAPLLMVKKQPSQHLTYKQVFAVKPSGLTVPVVGLPQIRSYIGRAVAFEATVSSAPQVEEMRLSATANLRLSGYVFPGLPFQGTATGPIEGKVYDALISFRVSSETGLAVSAQMDFLPSSESQESQIPPYALRRLVPGFTNNPVCNMDDLAHFLREAKDKQQRLLFIGKPDASGNLHIEAIGHPVTKETFALAVYQPLEQILAAHS